MVEVSDAFKNAIANNNEQYCLLDYGNTFFTAEDVSMDQGIDFSQPFNTDTDLTMGQCPSATLNYTLFNDSGVLNDFTFGEHKAWLGVRTETTTYENYGVSVPFGDYRFYWESGILKYNGATCAAQPSGTECVMILDGSILYCVNTNAEVSAFTVGTDGTLTVTDAPELDPFMKLKLTTWQGVGIYRTGYTVYLCEDGEQKKIEYAPLGVFIADRPNVVNKKQINISCKDQMSKFDIDLPNFTYPITIASMLSQICETAGVLLKTTGAFINSDLVIKSKPSDFKTATCRDALSWIAEAACSFARFDREGKLELVWFTDSTLTLDESGYSSNEEYWYETAQIDKLVVRDSDKSTDTVVGDGDNGYIIENNPLLK